MKFSRGFTLVELLVVLAIILLLSSIVFSTFVTANQKSRDGRRMQDLKEVTNALILYFDSNGSKYPSVPPSCSGGWAQSNQVNCWKDLATLLNPWLSTLAVDPLNGQLDANGVRRMYIYQPTNNYSGFRLATVFEVSTGLGDGCSLNATTPAEWSPPALSPALSAFYCVGDNWR